MLLAGCATVDPPDGGPESMAPEAATNLALNRPATASSVEKAGLEPGNAVDGSTSTRWSSQFSDPQWIYVDLGATYNVTDVKLTWEAAYAAAYQIQVSADASSWTTIFSTTSGAGGVENRSGLSGTGRYVRINGTKRATVWGYSLWEIAVHGTPVTAPGGGAFALRQPGVAAQSFSGSSVSCTFASAPSAGDLVVVGAGWFDNGTTASTVAVADGNGHAFQIDSHTSGTTNVGTAGQPFQAYLLAAPSNASNTITATFGNAFTYGAIWCDDFAVSGGTAQLDSGAFAAGTGALTSPTIPVSGAGRLVYAVAMDADSVGSVESPWTANAGGVQSGNEAAYVLSASSSTAVAFNGTGNDAYNAIGMSFTVAGSSTTATATLAASPSTITSGQSATLSWSSTNAASCTGTGFTANGTSGSATVKPTATTTYSVSCGGASASAVVTVSSSSGFALGQAPFVASSSWNTPVPSGATFTKLGWPAYTGYNYGVAWSGFSPSVFIAGPSDPVVSVSYPAGWGYPGGTLQIRMPAAANGANGTDGELVVIADNVVHNFWQFDRTSTTTATASSYGAANALTGTGWGTSGPFLSAGITAAGSSEFAGLLVQAETDAGDINHALQIAADSTITQPGFTGQAISGDGGASNGLFQEGAHLAIPPGTAMPSGLSPLGQKVFRAYVKYGAFIIDVAGGTSNLRAQANAYDEATMDALQADLGKLTPLLQAVH